MEASARFLGEKEVSAKVFRPRYGFPRIRLGEARSPRVSPATN